MNINSHFLNGHEAKFDHQFNADIVIHVIVLNSPIPENTGAYGEFQKT